VSTAAADAARLLEIIGVNILLSCDNAVVVAMTIRHLSAAQRSIVSTAGIAGAVLLQIAATLTVARLLAMPPVTLAGGVLLCVIAIRLLRQNGNASEPAIPDGSYRSLPASIAAVAAGYFMMSLDNILGVAAVGRGHPWLLTAGVLLSSAVLIPASLLVTRLMQRYRLTLTIGAGIVGWVAGSMLAAVVLPLIHPQGMRAAELFLPIATTAIVLTSPLWLRD